MEQTRTVKLPLSFQKVVKAMRALSLKEIKPSILNHFAVDRKKKVIKRPKRPPLEAPDEVLTYYLMLFSKQRIFVFC